ncbi:MAG: hypothetical protein QOD60_2219 [Solirubrobacterales bacterium]|nr:hypothetical protein [Solirubrobacterales bacterium]
MVVGAALVIGGVIGFFYAAGFDTGNSICSGDGCDKVFGVLAVNGWHNLIHIATGAIGLIALSYGYSAQRAYALYVGVIYIVVAVLGFTDFGSGDFNNTILKVIPVNSGDNFLHLILGALGVGAGLATPRKPKNPATARRPAAAKS